MLFVLSAIAAAFILGSSVHESRCGDSLIGYSCHEIAYRGSLSPVVDLRHEAHRLNRVWIPVQYSTPSGSSDRALVTVADARLGQTRVMNRIDGTPMGPLVWTGPEIYFENYNQAGFTLSPKRNRIGFYSPTVMEVQLRAEGIDRQVLRCSLLAYTNTDYLNCELWSFNRETDHFEKRGYLGFVPAELEGAPQIDIKRYPAPPARTVPPARVQQIPPEPMQPQAPIESRRRQGPVQQAPVQHEPIQQQPTQQRPVQQQRPRVTQEPIQQPAPGPRKKGPSTTQLPQEVPVKDEIEQAPAHKTGQQQAPAPQQQ